MSGKVWRSVILRVQNEKQNCDISITNRDGNCGTPRPLIAPQS